MVRFADVASRRCSPRTWTEAVYDAAPSLSRAGPNGKRRRRRNYADGIRDDGASCRGTRRINSRRAFKTSSRWACGSRESGRCGSTCATTIRRSSAPTLSNAAGSYCVSTCFIRLCLRRGGGIVRNVAYMGRVHFRRRACVCVFVGSDKSQYSAIPR